MGYQEWFASFKPGFDPVPVREKLRSSMAAFAGILLLGVALQLLSQAGYPLSLMASMAAAAVLLFAVPHSPMAQPWSLVGGNLLSGMVGWACSLLIPDPVLAAACAVGMAVLVMHLLHCLHPPGGATALIMVLGAGEFHQHGWQWAASIVLANTLLFLLLVLIINNLIPGRRYPQRHASTARASSPHVVGSPTQLETGDVEWALTQMNGVIDVSEADLLEIYRLAAEKALGRLRAR